MAVVDNERLLLTGDVGPDGLNEAADYATLMEPMGPLRFMQVPHHGSCDNVTPAVLDRWFGSRVTQGVERGVAYASVGINRTEHPRAQVTNAFRRRGLSGTHHAELGEAPSAKYGSKGWL
jgi:beta-lactamase superfamily II metal-dependent hydrolase